jgi:restriction system protein
LTTTWVIRSGRHGERDQWCLTNGLAGGGWNEWPDLTTVPSRDAMRALTDQAKPDATPGARGQWASQLWGLLQVKEGDTVVLPLKTTKAVAVGVCTHAYSYVAHAEASERHRVGVDWKRDDVQRTAIKQDLLYSLGGLATVYRVSRNEANARFLAIMQTGEDPGSVKALAGASPAAQQDAADAELSDPLAAPTMETIRDRVRTHLAENFKGHELTELVADILRVRGFVCEVSPPGPDQGVDILAGSGPLGLDSPTLIVEVKSETGQISAPVVRGLQGAMLSNRSDQCLLVAWGGITKDARREIRTDRLSMRIWTADDLLDQLFDVYEHLPDETRSRIPLKRAWVLDEEAG